MTKIIITGGCGFIGHHFVEHLCLNTDWEIIILDKLSYASMGLDRLKNTNIFDKYKILVIEMVMHIILKLRSRDMPNIFVMSTHLV